MLIVIPRTALLLEEAVRVAKPLSTMRRSTPMSGTRMKRLRPPSNGGSSVGGGGGGAGVNLGAPHHSVDGEWVAQSSRRTEAARVAPVVRSGSGSFVRTITTIPKRNSSHRPTRSSGDRNGLYDLGNAPGGAEGVIVVPPSGGFGEESRKSIPSMDRTERLIPGESPGSMRSAYSYGGLQQLIISDAVAAPHASHSACEGSFSLITSPNTRSRTSKMLKSLGKQWLVRGNDRGSPRRVSIRGSRGGWTRSSGPDLDDSRVGADDGRRAGDAAPHVPFFDRRQHSQSGRRYSSHPAAGAGCNSSGSTASSGRRSSNGRNYRNSSTGSSRRAAAVTAAGGRSTTVLPSPVESTASTPSVPSWRRSSSRASSTNSSRKVRERERISAASMSDNPDTIFLGKADVTLTGDPTDDDGQRRAPRDDGINQRREDCEEQAAEYVESGGDGSLVNDHIRHGHFDGVHGTESGGSRANAGMCPHLRDTGMDGSSGGAALQATTAAASHIRIVDQEATVEVGPPYPSESEQERWNENPCPKALRQIPNSTAPLERIAIFCDGAGGGVATAAMAAVATQGGREGRSAYGLGDGSAATSRSGDVYNNRRQRLGVLDKERGVASLSGGKEWPWPGTDVSSIPDCSPGVGAVGGDVQPMQNAAVASRHTGKRRLAESTR